MTDSCGSDTMQPARDRAHRDVGIRNRASHFRSEVEGHTAKVKEVIVQQTKRAQRVIHAIATNNNILRVRIEEDGKLILEKTIKSVNPALKYVGKQAHRKWRGMVTGDPDKRIREHMREEPQVRMLDKFSFTLGVFVILFSEYVVLRHPAWFTAFYVVLTSALCALRYILYRQQKYQLFMLDFCYLANFSCIMQTALFPDNLLWFHANFASSLGPVLAAIAIWHNSLVFHSLDKLTSFFLHAFPPILCHLYRWQMISTKSIIVDSPVAFLHLYLPGFGLYVLWQIIFTFTTECLLAEDLAEDPELITSVRYLARDRKNIVTKVVNCACRRIGMIGEGEYLDPDRLQSKVAFILTQALYTSVLLVPGCLVYYSYIASLFYMLAVFLIGTWNGASYYIEIFSKRYNLKFEDETKQAGASHSDSDARDVSPRLDSESSEQSELSEAQEAELVLLIQAHDSAHTGENADGEAMLSAGEDGQPDAETHGVDPPRSV